MYVVTRIRRYVLTGAPGAGKTAVAAVLRAAGRVVVDEAATDINAQLMAEGVSHPWRDPDFLDRIAALQRDRQLAAIVPPDRVQLYDRSPICTVALARYLGRSMTPVLAAEVDRVQAGDIYERRVFFVRPIGFLVATDVRRISYPDSLRFETVHEQVYREYGFEIVDVPAGLTVDERAALVERHLSAG